MKKSLLLLLTLLFIQCAGKQVVRFERYSVSMILPVESDSTVYVGTPEKFLGVLSVQPILKAETVQTPNIKLIENFGKFFICADQFRNIWMVEPKGDGISAKYKAIDVTPKDKTDRMTETGFSRYGSDDKVCIKFRFNKEEVFINKKGEIDEKCK
jgi:hypothetical protein